MIRPALIALALLLPWPAVAGGESSSGLPDRPERPTVGAAQNLRIDPDLTDAEPFGDGLRWRQVVQVEGAAFLKPRFLNFNLAPGDTLVVRSASGRVVETLQGRGPKGAGSFWGLSSFGDRFELELFFRRPYPQRPFLIEQVIVGDPEILAEASGGSEGVHAKTLCEPADFEDVVCYQGDADTWANVLASVGVMTVGGDPAGNALWCSGVNVSPDSLILTNHHCVANTTECANTEFVFKYYRTGCNDGSPTNLDWQAFRCDTTLAASPFNGICNANLDNLDYSLNSVVGDPASTFGYVDTDPEPVVSGEAVYIVQHPSGRPHEITHGSGEDFEVDGTVLRYYDTLDTESGSSGSPIFRQSDHRLVGLHHCGGCATPGVGNRGMLMSDIVPEIDPFLCAASVRLVGGEISDLTEVIGNGDGLLDPGETWQFTPVLRNRACDLTALDVEAELVLAAGSAGPVELSETVLDFGDISPGSSASASMAVQFQLSNSADCAGSVAFDLIEVSASNGGEAIVLDDYWSVPVGGVPTEVVLFEDLTLGIPGDWTVVDGGTGSGPASTWTADNPGERPLALFEPFAIVDAREHGANNLMDESLITPVHDLSAYSAAELYFQHDFRYGPGGLAELADVDVRSSATEGEWVNVARFTGGDRQGLVQVDISAQAAGQDDVQIRFRYHNAALDWWWAIDDVFVTGNNGPVCERFDLIFTDGFESSDTLSWSSTHP